MKFARKVLVAVGLNENLNDWLKPLKEMDFLKHSEIHFVHVFNTVNYSSWFGEFPLAYPVEADRHAIEEAVHSILITAGEKSVPAGFDGKMVQKVIFGENPKSAFSAYANEIKPDLIIVPTRHKHGLFDSSFGQYVNKHTHANVIFLKNH
jgi:nucleotide-binding universal stress UspA family protein